MTDDDIHIRRLEVNPPGESFEATWMEAKKLLEDAGSKDAFIVLTVRDVGENLDTKIAMSTGSNRLDYENLMHALETYFPRA